MKEKEVRRKKDMWNEQQREEFKQRMREQKAQKKDYIVPCSNIQTQYDTAKKLLRLRIGTDQSPMWFDINSWMGSQIAEKCHIPKPYYEYLLDNDNGKHAPLLATSINELIQDKEKRMVRTIGGTARALVSDSYRPVDNYDMFEFFTDAIDTLNQTQSMDIVIDRCEITDTKLYMRAISNQLTDEIFGEIDREKVGVSFKNGGLKKGDVVHGGIQVFNSEVGSGSYGVEPFLHVVSCDNGMISDQAVRRRHLGKKLDEQVIDWSTKTMQLEDETLWSKMSDLVYSTFNPDLFKKWCDNINNKASEEITTPIIALNHVVSSYKQFKKDDHEQLLTRFAKYGYTRWGLTQTITDFAQTKPFDTRVEMEKLANDICLNTPIEVLSRKDKEILNVTTG